MRYNSRLLRIMTQWNKKNKLEYLQKNDESSVLLYFLTKLFFVFEYYVIKNDSLKFTEINMANITFLTIKQYFEAFCSYTYLD